MADTTLTLSNGREVSLKTIEKALEEYFKEPATAAYSVRTKTAEELTPAAEQRLSERIMREVKLWHKTQ